MTMEGTINDDIATLTTGTGVTIALPVVRAETNDDSALIALGEDGTIPPAITVGDVDGALKALYHISSPDDTIQVNAEWRGISGNRYAWIETPLGIIELAAEMIVPDDY